MLALASLVIATVGALRSATADTVVVRAPRSGFTAGDLATAPTMPLAPAGPTEVLDGVLRADVLALGVRRVIIDAGHGGDQPGHVERRRQFEKEIVTLDIAERLR